MNSAKLAITKIFSNIRGSTPTHQLAAGAGAGILTGIVAVKIARPITLSIGTGVILLQLAENQGMVKAPFEQIKKIGLDPAKISIMGKSFQVGFAGGFLVGVAI